MKLISTLLLLCSFYFVSAQEKKTVQNMNSKFYPVEIGMETVSDKNFSCSFLFGADSIKAIILDNDAKLVSDFTIAGRASVDEYLGSFIKEGNIYLYTNNGLDAGIHVRVFNLQDHTVKDNVIQVKRKKDRMLSRISIENRFFYLTLNKSSADFVVYDFKDEKNYDTSHYVADPVTEKKIRKDIIWYAPEFDIGNVNMPGECEPGIAKCHNKLYFRNDTLFLLSNKTRSVTTVFEFDLINKKISSRDIQHNHNEENSVDNSFLLNNRLYYVSATGSRLFVQVVDFYAGNLLKEFTANEGEEISFKNSPITQEGGAFGDKELGKTRQLLRKMANGGAVIAASQGVNGGQVQISIGSYLEGRSVSQSGVPGTMSSMVVTGGTWSKSARFKMLFDPQANEHVSGELAPNINDRIEEYTKEIKIPYGLENIFMRNNSYYYCYYDKKLKTFNAVKF